MVLQLDRSIVNTVNHWRGLRLPCRSWCLARGHIGAWQEVVQTLTPALSQLNGSAVQLDQVVNSLKESMTPATTVSENFKQASNQLQAVFPNISDTADSYHQFNRSLQEAANALAVTAAKYSKAGGDMGGLLSQIEQSLDLQNQSNQSVSTTLQGSKIPSTTWSQWFD